MRLSTVIAALCLGCGHYPKTAPPSPEPPFDVVTHVDGWEMHKITILCSCPPNFYCIKDSCKCIIERKGDAVISVVMNCGLPND